MRGFWFLLGLSNLAIAQNAQKNDTGFVAQGLGLKASPSPKPSPAADLQVGDGQRNNGGRTYDTCTNKVEFVTETCTVTEHKTHTEVSSLLPFASRAS